MSLVSMARKSVLCIIRDVMLSSFREVVIMQHIRRVSPGHAKSTGSIKEREEKVWRLRSQRGMGEGQSVYNIATDFL